MKLRYIEIFHAIMVHGSVSEAARALNITQPSVSIALKRAEQSLGLKLFERIAGRLVPTPEAEDLFPGVDRIHDQLGQLSTFARDLRTGRTKRVSVIANPTFTSTILPLAIARFRERFADVRVQLHAPMSPYRVAERVAQREFDMGVVYGPAPDLPIAKEVIGYSGLGCAMPRRHPLATQEGVAPQDLIGQPLISFGAGTFLRSLTEDYFREAGCGHVPSVEVGSSATGCVLAREGAGIAIVDLLVAATGFFDDLVIRPLMPSRPIELLLLFPKNRPNSRLSQELAETLRDVARQHLPHTAHTGPRLPLQ